MEMGRNSTVHDLKEFRAPEVKEIISEITMHTG